MNRSVFAGWDPAVSVWTVFSDDVPGLVTEAPTLDMLDAKLQVIVPELLQANNALPPEQDLELELHLGLADRADCAILLRVHLDFGPALSQSRP